MMHVQRIVEVDASQDGEDVGLEERNEELKPVKATMTAERAQPPKKPRATTKAANTFSMVWPAIMLANSRTDRLIGRVNRR